MEAFDKDKREYFGNRKSRHFWNIFRIYGEYEQNVKAARLLLKMLDKEDNYDILKRIYHYADLFVEFGEDNEGKPQSGENGLESVLESMKEEVDSLVMCRTDKVRIKYGGMLLWLFPAYYSPVSCSISVSHKIKEEMIAMTVAHEYTHHVESGSITSLFGSLDVLTEGVAEAIAVAATKKYAHRKNDKLSLDYAKKSITLRLAGAIDLIDIFERGFGGPCSQETFKKNFQHKYSYAIGCAAFLVAEMRNGQGIYKDILRTEDSLGLLVDMLGGQDGRI